ncbi:MAG: hypothetical protein JWQ74_3698 [Marmoricola sp.]|nr:hypothetical protein [Marmoricola sp.]
MSMGSLSPTGGQWHVSGGIMKLAHFGTFDVHNYGDLLFPLIVEKKLADIADEFVHISPVGGPIMYSDVSASIPFSVARNMAFDGVVIGGGNILHSAWTDLPDYDSVKYSAYLSLWHDAMLLATEQGIPLVTNAPGAPYDFPWPASKLIRELRSVATYFSVRDRYSSTRVAKAGVLDALIVPDSALQLSDVLDFVSGPLSPFDGELTALNEAPYIAVHVNGRYSSSGVKELAALLDSLSLAKQARICLIGIGPCHGDDVYAKQLGSFMTTSPVIFANPGSVTSIAKVIAGAEFYVGSSLHGFITASSFSVPAFLVASHKKQSKFRGLLEQIDSVDRMLGSWSEAFHMLTTSKRGLELLGESADLAGARSALDEHWHQIRVALTTSNPHVQIKPAAPAIASIVIVRNVVESRARRAIRSILNRIRRR